MNYVFLPLGKGSTIPKKSSEYPETKIASLFKKVYVNGLYIGYPFTMVLVSELSDSHSGRHSIKYSEKYYFNNGSDKYENQIFLNKVREKFDIAEYACWFVYEIRIINQDELHLSAIIVDKDNAKYESGNNNIAIEKETKKPAIEVYNEALEKIAKK